METKKVYAVISAVAKDLADAGIAKCQKNKDQGYMFRGIDDVYNAAAPLMAKHGLVTLPRYTERTVTERTSKHGSALFYVALRGEIDFVAAEDGSCHTVVVYGEAMDASDKATNKAMAACHKYAIVQSFCIPTEGDNDAVASSPEVRPAETKAEPTLTAEQVATIIALAQEVGADVAKIAPFYRAAKLEDVPAAAYGNIVKLLEKKRGA